MRFLDVIGCGHDERFAVGSGEEGVGGGVVDEGLLTFGDAEKPLCTTTSPKRPCHSTVPDLASYAVATPAWSLIMYSSSP